MSNPKTKIFPPNGSKDHQGLSLGSVAIFSTHNFTSPGPAWEGFAQLHSGTGKLQSIWAQHEDSLIITLA